MPLQTEKEQDSRSLSKKFTSEEKDITDEHSSEKSEQFNTEEEDEGALQAYIICLKWDLEEKVSLSKISCLI